MEPVYSEEKRSLNNQYALGETYDDLYQRPAAVVIRDAKKSYAKGKNVINGLNMTILQGTIYSLLGCSGCGKSTTLSCLLGIQRFSSGAVWLFGNKPGTKKLGIPGRNVGFMPQEYSLYNEFTIMETFIYFGILNGMDKYEIMCSTVFYTNLLNLPKYSRRIGKLSGGQKRRVSFAISLLHEPELVILDEPTAGVDPLLRESIWKHLVNLTKTKNITVIITTHYIEEARHSDMVGIMSNGKLIAEESPAILLDRFQTNSMEQVVLQLTRNEKVLERLKEVEPAAVSRVGSEGGTNTNLKSIIETLRISSSMPPMAAIKSKSSAADSLTRIWALVNKNALNALRSITMLIMLIIIPAVGMTANLIANGNNLKGLNFGVVNEEMPTSSNCYDVTVKQSWEGICNIDYFSCRYLKHLESTPTFNLKRYHSKEEATEAVTNGDIWGYLHFPKDYSWFLFRRATSGLSFTKKNNGSASSISAATNNTVTPESTSNLNSNNNSSSTESPVLDMNATDTSDVDTEEIFKNSALIVRLDETNQLTSHLLKPELYSAYQNFLHEYLILCKHNPEKADFGLIYKTPILGENVRSFNDFLMPSIFIGFMFFWPIVTTGVNYVGEKRDGTMERSLVAGIRVWEIFFSTTVTESFIAVSRMVLMYFLTTYAFEMHIEGSLWLQFILSLMSSYMGVFAGFLLGSFCTEEIQISLLSMAIFFPNLLLSGMCWPVEGMPEYLQKVSYTLPCTLACESMRSIASRGWGITHPNVWPGFVSSVGYMLLYFILAVVVSHLRFIK